jgi:aromatic-L-amino-acid/L-tryptophan decarboxylase
MPYPLEPSAEQMRKMGEAALEYLVGFVDGLPEAPAVNVDRALEVAEQVRGAPPEEGRPFEAALEAFAAGAANAYEPAGPGYFAHIPGGGLYTAALASFLAAGVNRFVNLAGTAPAFVQIEENVLSWLAGLFQLPLGAGGILTSGGSMANLSAIATARRDRLPEDFLRGTIYVSEQVHASVPKAAALAGFPAANVVRVPVTRELRMDVDALFERVRADRGAGLEPFCVVGNVGTTNTGAIDPLDDLARVAADEGLWFHADAAYGGFFQLTERGSERFRGVERADSITLDPHKGMFLPYGTGSLLVRDRSRLRLAHSTGGADYLQDVVAGGHVLPNFTEYSPELSREFRGLRVWLPLVLHGVRAFRNALDEKLDLAAHVDDRLREIPELELPWAPELSIVAFRLAGSSGADVDALAETNEANRRLLERINASKRVFLSSTMLDGRFTLRVAILSHRSHRDRIDEAIEVIGRASTEV